jgi:hypothetical protein
MGVGPRRIIPVSVVPAAAGSDVKEALINCVSIDYSRSVLGDKTFYTNSPSRLCSLRGFKIYSSAISIALRANLAENWN